MFNQHLFKIIQWNARSIKHELNKLSFQAVNADIFIISKTWVEHTDSVKLKNFDTIRKDRSGRKGGGILIFIQSNLKYQIIKIYKDTPDCQGRFEFCGVELFLDSGKFVIISIYRAPDALTINS